VGATVTSDEASAKSVSQLIDEQQTVRVAAILHRSVAYRIDPR
jgi:hypothetical protein